jgi:uncharacterized Zn-binding protein involved in type VI secretion
MPKLARVGDPGSHGGKIATGSSTVSWNGRKAARVGDTYACALHGPNPIVTGSPRLDLEGRKAARVGDKTACGATIVDGSPDTFAD